MYKVNNFIFSLILALIFCIISVATVNHYGISWDETIHFSRGQSFLYYFLTGETNYKKLKDFDMQGTFGKPENYPVPRRSFYQLNDFHNAEYYFKDVGHPPLNDILAALSNYVFFQKLGIVGDIEAYHLFNILASTVLVFVVVIFAKETYGTLAATVSFLTLCTYPLFWAEAHFNIKDFPLAAFFAGFVWAFYKSLKQFSMKWLVLAVVFFCLGLGTKFNILFSLPIVLLYFFIRFQKNIKVTISFIPKKYYLFLIISPVIILGTLTLYWPLLWHDWFANLIKVFNYYQQIGSMVNYQPDRFYLAGFNFFPISWILFTTPPITLLFTLLGIVFTLIGKREKTFVSALWLIWFLLPIIRVMVPGSTIYGGIRQISEFIPAMALLAGLGACWLFNIVKNHLIGKWLYLTVLVVGGIGLIVNLVRWHPNENVYFNTLIGGLKGAKEKDFPSWGNSFGNAYFQGIRWLNTNAPKNAKLTLIQGTKLNAPPILLRSDIDFSILNWSGMEKKGEYLMELTFNDTGKAFYYIWEYVDKFLNPVFEVEVDGVPILKIWQNDLEHTKKEYQKVEGLTLNWAGYLINGQHLTLDLRRELLLMRMDISFTINKSCSSVGTVFIETSLDNKEWLREKDWIPYPQMGYKDNMIDNKVEYLFAGRKARYVRLFADSFDTCLFNKPDFNFHYLVEQ